MPVCQTWSCRPWSRACSSAIFWSIRYPRNFGQFDHLVVVTDRKDKKTQRLCRSLSVQCVVTDDFYHGGDNFNKARGINIGLAHLMPGGWRLHLDADIVLPPHFRHMIRRHPLQKHCIYGADRVNVHGYEAWRRVRSKMHGQYNHHFMVTPHDRGDHGTSIGSRFLHSEWGYCPIGYFQLWHSDVGVRYPVNQGSAEHTDVTFAIQWQREERHIIPELFVYHLMMDGQRDGENWQGRKTPPFEPRPYCHQ
jgi:hypothetical protein